jgi:hypothetical protein
MEREITKIHWLKEGGRRLHISPLNRAEAAWGLGPQEAVSASGSSWSDDLDLVG